MFTNALIPEDFTQRRKEHKEHGGIHEINKFFGFPL
jgi:hypothetical protein